MSDYYCPRCRRDDCTSFHRCFFGSRYKPRPSLRVSPIIRKIYDFLNSEEITFNAEPKDIEFFSVYRRATSSEKSAGAWCWSLRHRLKYQRLIVMAEGIGLSGGVGSYVRAKTLVKNTMGLRWLDVDLDIYNPTIQEF